MSKKKDKRTYRLITADQAWDLAESGIKGIQVLVDRTWSSPDVLAYRRKAPPSPASTMTRDLYVSMNYHNTYRVEVE